MDQRRSPHQLAWPHESRLYTEGQKEKGESHNPVPFRGLQVSKVFHSHVRLVVVLLRLPLICKDRPYTTPDAQYQTDHRAENVTSQNTLMQTTFSCLFTHDVAAQSRFFVAHHQKTHMLQTD